MYRKSFKTIFFSFILNKKEKKIVKTCKAFSEIGEKNFVKWKYANISLIINSVMGNIQILKNNNIMPNASIENGLTF